MNGCRLLVLLLVLVTGPSTNLAVAELLLNTPSSAKLEEALNDTVSLTDYRKYLYPELITATVDLVGTVPLTHLQVTFQGEPDEYLLHALWAEGVAVQLVRGNHLWETLWLSSYTHTSQYLLVGDLQWIISIITRVKSFYRTAKLNAMKTHWFWLVMDLNLDDDYTVDYTTQGSLPDSSWLPLPFQRAMSEVEAVLFEGMHGLLIWPSWPRSPPTTPPTATDRWVAVGGVDAPGDGSWRVRVAAVWGAGGLKVFTPLWPTPSFNLRGRVLRINCLKKPTVFLFKDGHHLAEARGYAADITRLIQQRLNFTDVLVPNTGFGAFRNGSWNGMVGDLLYGKADVAPLDFTPIWQRSLVIDFGIIYSTDDVVIISKAPGVYMKPLLLLQIFPPFVWASLVVGVVVTGVVVGGLTWAREAALGQGDTVNPSSYCTTTLKIVVYQSCRRWPSWSGGRVVSGSVMFLAVVVGSLYSGSITAFLAIPFRSQPINSLEELLETRVVPAIRRLSSPYSFFLTENSGVLGKKVREVMVVFSGTEVSTWNFLKEVAHGTYGFIDTASSAIGRSSQYEKLGKPCLFHVGRNPVRMDLDSFAYPKNSPVKYQFDEIMRWLRSYGIVEYLKGGYYGQACSTNLASDQHTPISLTQAQGAFYVLGVGLVLAVVTILGELALYRLTRNKWFPPRYEAPVRER